MHWTCFLVSQTCSMSHMALLFCSTYSLDIVLHSPNLFGGDKNCFKKILEASKTQKLPSQVEKCQNFLDLTELENVFKNVLDFPFTGANVFNVSYGYVVVFYRISRHRITFQKLI